MSKKKQKSSASGKQNAAAFFCIKPKDELQRQFIASIKRNFITFGIGVAGTGKTLLAVYTAMQMIFSEQYPQEQLIYVRANVGLKDEKDIGCMPGSYNEKVYHLALPIYDNLVEFMSEGAIKKAFSEEVIVISPLVFLRGRSFKNAIVVLDEAQNCTYDQLKTVISRCAENTKLILIGDPGQIDIKLQSGFLLVLSKLKHLSTIGQIKFKTIFRNAFLQEIMELL